MERRAGSSLTVVHSAPPSSRRFELKGSTRRAEEVPVFKKVIVGVDFSEPSERAARVAVELAKSLGGEVVIVHVMSTATTTDPGRMVELRPGLEEELRKVATRLAGSSNVKVDWGLVDGQPAQEIATF